MVLALVIGGLASDATDVAAGSYAEANDLIGLAAIAALWWRRRAPLAVAAVTFLAAALAPMAGGAAIVSVYTIASADQRRGSRPMAALYGLYLVTGAVSMLTFPDEQSGQVAGVLAAILLTVAAYGWGLAARSRRELLAAYAERAERAESDQQARVMEGRRAERTQIAAEMHDVLAHRLSLLSLHAGAIEYRPGARPEDLAEAATVIRSMSHLALEDLRTVIGVLRDDSTGDLAPQPTLADVEALVAECRAAGMAIDVVGTVEDPASVPAEIGRHAYRAAREGLTNARKHAPGRSVELLVDGQAGEGLRVEVHNDVPAAVAPTTIPGTGTGLIGLGERMELAGGTLEHSVERIGSTDRHRLRVWLPWT